MKNPPNTYFTILNVIDGIDDDTKIAVGPSAPPIIATELAKGLNPFIYLTFKTKDKILS